MTSVPAEETFASRLREARTRNGWTQNQVEEWSGLAHGILAQFEAGVRTPCFDNLRKLCLGLRVSSDWLMGLREVPEDGSLDRP